VARSDRFIAIVVTDSVWTLATDPRADPRLVALLAQLGAADPPPAPPFTRASPREDVLAWFAGVEPRPEELFAAVSAPEVGGVSVETTRILGPDGICGDGRVNYQRDKMGVWACQ
jgi:hypothetical protein